MRIFKKLFGGKKYDAVLNKCDLAMSRDEIIDFHKIVKAEAGAEGGAYLFPKKYFTAWEVFRLTRTLTCPNLIGNRARLI
jgi:hypothetical protein